MTTIQLNQEKYTLGVDTFITIGFNRKNNPCISRGVLCANANGRLFAKTEGIEMWVDDADLKELFLDTKENIKTIKAKIAQKLKSKSAKK